MKKGVLIIVVIVIAIIVVLVIIKSSKQYDEAKSRRAETQEYYEDIRKEGALKYEAYERAKNVIKELLKSPSTAQFPEYSDVKNRIYRKDSLISVSSFVDAHNAYGALLKADYSVDMVYVYGKWNLVSIYYDGEKVFP